jgi:putative membrane protein
MTHKRNKTTLAIALASLGFAVGALAASPGKLDSGDRKFIEEAAMGGMAEVELGRMVQSRAQNDQVKQFAQRMVTDHTKANDDLKQLAGSKGIEVPPSVDRKHQKEIDEIAKKDAAKLDREYMEHMVKEHKKDVREFEKQAKKAKDPDVQGFASKTLPTLKEHLALAQQVESAVKGKGR